MNIIPNTTGAIAFVEMIDDFKPYIATFPVLAWEHDGEDTKPVFSFTAKSEIAIVIAYYHSNMKILETIGRATSLYFGEDGSFDFTEAKFIIEDEFKKEVA